MHPQHETPWKVKCFFAQIPPVSIVSQIFKRDTASNLFLLFKRYFYCCFYFLRESRKCLESCSHWKKHTWIFLLKTLFLFSLFVSPNSIFFHKNYKKLIKRNFFGWVFFSCRLNFSASGKNPLSLIEERERESLRESVDVSVRESVLFERVWLQMCVCVWVCVRAGGKS